MGASFPIIFTLIALIIGIATGGTIVISQFFGAKDYKKVKRAIDTLFIVKAISALLILCLSPMHGQYDYARFQRITINDGLSLSSVYNISQDSKGFMW